MDVQYEVLERKLLRVISQNASHWIPVNLIQRVEVARVGRTDEQWHMRVRLGPDDHSVLLQTDDRAKAEAAAQQLARVLTP